MALPKNATERPLYAGVKRPLGEPARKRDLHRIELLLPATSSRSEGCLIMVDFWKKDFYAPYTRGETFPMTMQFEYCRINLKVF